MKYIRKILKYIATGFLVFLVSLCLYTFIVTDILKKDYVNVFGYSYFVVATGSMSGYIEVNDIIFVRLDNNIKHMDIDDVITFKNKDGEIITHRIISKSGKNIITQGDRNNTPDEAITSKDIIGKVKLVIPPSLILKSIAIFLIVFIFLALINFDNIMKKFVVKETKKPDNKLPDEIFMSAKKMREEEKSTGNTVLLALDEVEQINKNNENELVKEELQANKFNFVEDGENLSKDDDLLRNIANKGKKSKEKDILELVLSILKCKKENTINTKMNKKWLTRFQYVYKLCLLVSFGNFERIAIEVENPPFKEIYDYDLDKVGLSDVIRNKISEMPIYVILRLMTFTILYNDDELFDGIFKILKYKVAIDKNNEFKIIKRSDSYGYKQLNSLISFMNNISDKFDNKNVFDLDKIEKMVKIGNY